MGKPKDIGLVESRGKLYVPLSSSGIHFLCLDGMKITHFGNGTVPYLTIEQVIKWYRNELKHRKSHKLGRLLHAFTEIKRKFKAGQIELV